MSRARKIAIVIVVAVVIIAGGVWFSNKDSAVPSTTSQTSETDGSKFPDGLDVVYTGYGFSPDDWAVSPGATVNIINESSLDLEFASDPYPTSTANPEMNIGLIKPGKTKSFRITKEGSWGYHNHLEPTHHGRIAVLKGQ